MWVHQGSSGLLLLAAAGLLGTFGVGLAAHAFFRGRNARISWGNLAANVGGLAWLLPVAAVFALYGFWMRPNLINLPDTWSARPQISVVSAERNSNGQRVATPKPSPSAADSVEISKTLPAWVNETEIVSGDGRLVVVTGEIGATVEEAEANARAAAVDAVRKDFAVAFPQSVGWEPPTRAVGSVAVRRAFVAEIDRKTLSSGTPFRVFRAYNQVELSPAVRKRIFPLWREEVVGRRIWDLGGLGALLTLTFGTLAVYFRLDDRTSGLYRRRLKLAAVSVIAAGGLAAATLL
jgi:hypothetical protein